jgi:pimeloyl-ACP methyl ester carboxylesterase
MTTMTPPIITARGIQEFFARSRFSGLLLLIMVWGWRLPSAAEHVDLHMQEIALTTPDQVVIAGSWITAAGWESEPKKRPAVILLHDFGLDRRDWGVFIPDLVNQGFQVLALDLRGHGQSTQAGARESGAYSFGTSSAFLDAGLRDVQGAVQWLKKRTDVNAKAISIIGAGAGGDLAYVAARQFGPRQIKSAIVISPSPSALTEAPFIADSAARGVLFCVSTGDSNGSAMLAAESLANFTAAPKKVVVYASQARGLSMFYKHPEMGAEILAWLGQ